MLEQRLRDAEARSVLELLIVEPAIDTSAVTALKPDDNAEAESDRGGIPGSVGDAATNDDPLVVYQDY